MPVSTVSDVPVNAHVESLRAKHIALSQQIEDAQRDLSTSDFHLSQLKKQKLVIKEKLADVERQSATG